MLMKDQVVLITGAGRGWGRGIAQQFGRQGARVIVVSRTQSEIDQTVEELQRRKFPGGRALGGCF